MGTPLALDPKAREFVRIWKENPNVDKKMAALLLGVSRQTVYNWCHKLAMGQMLGTRGKHRKYGCQKSIPVALRLAELVQGRIKKVNNIKDEDVAKFLEMNLPVMYMEWEKSKRSRI